MVTLRTSGTALLILGLSVSSMSAMAGTTGTGTGTGKKSARCNGIRSKVADNVQESQKLVRPLIQQDNARSLKQLVDMYTCAGLGSRFNELVEQSFDYAVECGSIKCVRLLLPHVVEIKHGSLHDAGKKALLLAAEIGDEPLVDALLVGNTDVSLFDNDHFTALHHVAGYLFNEAMKACEEDDFSGFDESIHADIVLGIMQKITAEDPTLIYKTNNYEEDVLETMKTYAQSCRDEAEAAPNYKEARKWKKVAEAYDRLRKKIKAFASVK